MLQIELLIDGLAAGYHLLKEDGSLKIIGFPVGKDRYHHLGFWYESFFLLPMRGNGLQTATLHSSSPKNLAA